MINKLLVRSALAFVLLAPGAYAQTAPPAAAPAAASPAANPVDPASIQALLDMGAHLQTLKRFSVSTDVSGERVLADGQKLGHIAHADLDVARPNRLRARMFTARFERELFYDGKAVTLFTPSENYYSTVEFTGPLGELAKKLEDRYGVQIPLSDIFTWGTPAAPIDKIESAMNAGQDYVGKTLCDHYAFRQANIDWQIWISTGDKPLPRMIVITNRTDEARPQSVTLINWNLKPDFKDAVFKFMPPKGAKAIELVPVKSR